MYSENQICFYAHTRNSNGKKKIVGKPSSLGGSLLNPMATTEGFVSGCVYVRKLRPAANFPRLSKK